MVLLSSRLAVLLALGSSICLAADTTCLFHYDGGGDGAVECAAAVYADDTALASVANAALAVVTKGDCEALGAVTDRTIAVFRPGRCSLTSKVLNAENAGYAGVLVVSDTDQVIPPKLVEEGVSIPVVLIAAEAAPRLSGWKSGTTTFSIQVTQADKKDEL